MNICVNKMLKCRNVLKVARICNSIFSFSFWLTFYAASTLFSFKVEESPSIRPFYLSVFLVVTILLISNPLMSPFNTDYSRLDGICCTLYSTYFIPGLIMIFFIALDSLRHYAPCRSVTERQVFYRFYRAAPPRFDSNGCQSGAEVWHFRTFNQRGLCLKGCYQKLEWKWADEGWEINFLLPSPFILSVCAAFRGLRPRRLSCNSVFTGYLAFETVLSAPPRPISTPDWQPAFWRLHLGCAFAGRPAGSTGERTGTSNKSVGDFIQLEGVECFGEDWISPLSGTGVSSYLSWHCMLLSLRGKSPCTRLLSCARRNGRDLLTNRSRRFGITVRCESVFPQQSKRIHYPARVLV